MTSYINELKSEYSEMQNRINALKSEMQEKSKVLMKEAFRDFFEKYENVVENIFWAQYTPWFNDGETCEFGVNEVCLALKGDEDVCDYEGSTLHDQSTIDRLLRKIADWEEYEKDPMGAAKKYQSYYISRYNRNPFDVNNWQRKTEQQQMEEWRPHYQSKESMLEELEVARKIVEDYPNLKEDFSGIQSLISGIDEDLMLAMFGDHAKVFVTKDSIEVEEYSHD